MLANPSLKGSSFFFDRWYGKHHVLPIPATRKPAEPGGVVTSLRSIDPLLDFHRTVEIPGGNCFPETPGGQQRSSRSGKVVDTGRPGEGFGFVSWGDLGQGFFGSWQLVV